MKGGYDDNLKWPFEGDIIFELLNWREDEEHQVRTIVFSADTNRKYSSRVETEWTLAGWNDRHDVFSHSSLPYDPSTNTEYLHDDCLRLRVRRVHVYSMWSYHNTWSYILYSYRHSQVYFLIRRIGCCLLNVFQKYLVLNPDSLIRLNTSNSLPFLTTKIGHFFI